MADDHRDGSTAAPGLDDLLVLDTGGLEVALTVRAVRPPHSARLGRLVDGVADPANEV
jgi:hypothetical protein